VALTGAPPFPRGDNDMTSDGIPQDEWDKVNELAASVANAVCAEDEILSSKHTAEILEYLEVLELNHGELPSILATRADYVSAIDERVTLLRRAYDLADERKDNANLTAISVSNGKNFLNNK